MTTDIYPLIKNEIMGIEEEVAYVIDIKCETADEWRKAIDILKSKGFKGVGGDFLFHVAPYIRFWDTHKEYQTMIAAHEYAGKMPKLITAQEFIKQNS